MPDIKSIIFASNNKGKLVEVRSILSPGISVISLQEAGITEEIEEPYHTFKENAWAKANYIYNKTGQSCFAEDSGLVVPALQGEPGVFSARYAGDHATDADNNKKLLDKISNLDNIDAYYQAVICLIREGEIHYFEGRCTGRLTRFPKGDGGFGYDPLFIPSGKDQTFAELPLEVKNTISHRAKAMKQLVAFLKN